MFQNDKFFSLHARNLYTFLNHSFHIIFTNISKQFARCLTNKPINQLGVRKDSILCAFFTTSCRCEIAGYCLPTLIPAPRQNLLLMTYSNLCNPEECCRDSLKSSISSWHPDFTLWGNLHLPPEGQAYLGRGLFIPTCSTNNFHTSNVHSFVTYYFFLFAAIIQYDVTSLYPIFWRERERDRDLDFKEYFSTVSEENNYLQPRWNGVETNLTFNKTFITCRSRWLLSFFFKCRVYINKS